MTTTMASRFATEDTDVRITTYKVQRSPPIATSSRQRTSGLEKELPPGDDGVWYWHLDDSRDSGPFITEEGALKSARRAIELAGPG
jgi:hypothetical protein